MKIRFYFDSDTITKSAPYGHGYGYSPDVPVCRVYEFGICFTVTGYVPVNFTILKFSRML